jgi:trehalose/maltose transport system substrate-binding protein
MKIDKLHRLACFAFLRPEAKTIAERRVRAWRRFHLVLWVIASFCIPLGGPATADTIFIACADAVPKEFDLCSQGAKEWADRTGHKIRMIPTPKDANERLDLFQLLLAARSPDIDVLQIDVVWPGILASHLLDLTEDIAPEVIAEHFPVLISNNRVNNRLVALPWFVDTGLLYYRRDLLDEYKVPVPKTWQELTKNARFIQEEQRLKGQKDIWGFVWQGRAYEGLSCNALEWIHSSGGGKIVDGRGKITVANKKAETALKLAASWIDTITPKEVLNFSEEDALKFFQTGLAVFMRNWHYAYPLANGPESSVAGRFDIAPLPHGEGGASSATLGGWQLAVSRYSRSSEAAIDLVRALTSAKEQKRRAKEGGFNPTIERLYADPDLPLLGKLRKIFASTVARPSAVTGRRYNQVSDAFWDAVHKILGDPKSAHAVLDDLAGQLRSLSRGEQWDNPTRGE